ncbi:MAG: hypothetical protein MHM6MM_002542 [Cercozoa sp. M6MM]
MTPVALPEWFPVPTGAVLQVELPDCEVFALTSQSRTRVCTGALKVWAYGNGARRSYLFYVGDCFRCELSRELKVSKLSRRSYAFPQPQTTSYFAVLLAEETEAIDQEFFESFLANAVDYVIAHFTSDEHCVTRLTLESTSENTMAVSISANPEHACVLTVGVLSPALAAQQDRLAALGFRTASLVLSASNALAHGLHRGSQMVGVGIQKGAASIRGKVTPTDEPRRLSDTTKSRIATAKSLSASAVTVSAALVSGVVAVTSALASTAASRLRSNLEGDSSPSPRAQAAKAVAQSLVLGVGTVYESAAAAGINVLKETSEATADVITHKYGDEYGTAARDVGKSVTNTATAAACYRHLGVRAMAKSVAKKTAVELLENDEHEGDAQAEENAIASIMQAASTRPRPTQTEAPRLPPPDY